MLNYGKYKLFELKQLINFKTGKISNFKNIFIFIESKNILIYVKDTLDPNDFKIIKDLEFQNNKGFRING
jgi:hypothetical protein